MAKRNPGRGGRRKKRRTSAGAPGTAAEATATKPQAQRPSPRTRRTERRPPAPAQRPHRDPGGVGERPVAPWHPFPLSELLIFLGLVAIAVAAAKGVFTAKSHARANLPILGAGIGSVVLGTLEFSVREHLSGYRSHSSLLAAVPTAICHGGIAILVSSAGGPPALVVLGPLAVDIPVFWLLFRLLRARFDDARRERVLALRR